MLCPCLAPILNRTLNPALAVCPTVGGDGSPTSPVPELLWWKLNEGSGTVIGADVGPAGTASADAWTTPGPSGSGSAYNSNDANTIDSNSAITYGVNVITVCAWCNVSSWSDTQFVGANAAAFAANHWRWGTSGSELRPRESGSTTSLTRGEKVSGVTTGGWVHLACVFDNSTNTGDLKIYVDSVIVAEDIWDNDKDTFANFATAVLRVGVVKGAIADFRIYNRELSGAEIAEVYGDPQ